MRNKMKRLIALSGAVLVLVLCFPVTVFALDPITDAAIINAWAQAVAAYGAANGVQMTFDISDTDQIGESVHDLWTDYAEDMAAQDPLPFTTAATLFWQTGFTRIGNSLGIDISSELAGALDGFWNWLLSGPAEMVKVDNQFVWSLNASGEVEPIVVYRLGYNEISLVPSNSSDQVAFQASDVVVLESRNNALGLCVVAYQASTYCFYTLSGSTADVVFVCPDSGAQVKAFGGYVDKHFYGVSSPVSLQSTLSVDSVVYYYNTYTVAANTYDYNTFYVPYFPTIESGIRSFFSGSNSGLSVGPYGGTPGDITIPDNDDVNYQPLPVGIGIDIPWDAAKYGDGDTLTDAQKGSIVDDIDQQIDETGSVVLDENASDDPTIDDPTQEVIGGPNDYVVPGLEDVFPFCIPFDIYHFLAALSAEPVAPHFTAELAFPAAVGGTQTIDLDFNTPTFNHIAQIFRTMELLAFIVGLALLTRSMFIRG